MKKQNCWEFKLCGRGPNGKNDCPAVKDHIFNGVHGGLNAGRACWVVAGTLGDAKPAGFFAKTLKDCLRCAFFKAVEADEQISKTGFSVTRLGMLKMPRSRESDAQATFMDHKSQQIDQHLRNEFVQEVNNISSKKHSTSKEVIKEFAREVERLSSKK